MPGVRLWPFRETWDSDFSVCLLEANDGAIDLAGIKSELLTQSVEFLNHPFFYLSIGSEYRRFLITIHCRSTERGRHDETKGFCYISVHNAPVQSI